MKTREPGVEGEAAPISNESICQSLPRVATTIVGLRRTIIGDATPHERLLIERQLKCIIRHRHTIAKADTTYPRSPTARPRCSQNASRHQSTRLKFRHQRLGLSLTPPSPH